MLFLTSILNLFLLYKPILLKQNFENQNTTFFEIFMILVIREIIVLKLNRNY